MLGLHSNTVALKPHNPAWLAEFLREAAVLRQSSEQIIDIQHIGSTAIAGLDAKPIIDLLAGMPGNEAILTEEQTRDWIAIFHAAGYHFGEYASTPMRLFFYRGNTDFKTHHLHVVVHNQEAWYNLILFRDYLQTHPAAVQEYATLKGELASRYKEQRDLYTQAKSAFILQIINKSRLENAKH
jgi:GrpB-like predicted nucleotidyltransferase (UPF0157 family)